MVAKDWFQKAADQGHADAQNNLGIMYYEGEGVSRDFVKAAHWFRQSAEQGNADAQYNLGTMYEDGEGVPVDLVQAYQWFLLSAKQGDDDAKAACEHLVNRLSLAQLAEGKRLAKGWSRRGEYRRSF